MKWVVLLNPVGFITVQLPLMSLKGPRKAFSTALYYVRWILHRQLLLIVLLNIYCFCTFSVLNNDGEENLCT